MSNLQKQLDYAANELLLCLDVDRFGILSHGGEAENEDQRKVKFWGNEVQRLERLLQICPDCGESWNDGDIAERLYGTGYYRSPYLAEEAARNYGWTPENPTRFSKRLTIYSQTTDKTEANQCPFCNTIRCRWTNEVLDIGDLEL